MYTFVPEDASKKQDRQLQLKLICFNGKTFHSWLLIENVGENSIILYNYYACTVSRKSADFDILGLQVGASSYIQMNQPTRCSNFSGLLLVV
jgi:hypothetical protein